MIPLPQDYPPTLGGWVGVTRLTGGGGGGGDLKQAWTRIPRMGLSRSCAAGPEADLDGAERQHLDLRGCGRPSDQASVTIRFGDVGGAGTL